MPKKTALDIVALAFRAVTDELADDMNRGTRQLDADTMKYLGYSFHYELNRLAKAEGLEMTVDALDV